ncbi:MAG: phosphoribosylformylglycinamidine cyclo-ligase [Firmicutes bacterium]|jgi:phosphoribosylformylglycinamidine cyclo-ligase|nr:phosphoribosylformylglycinamidine cyclo-ligase [Bacillota bacterium]
MEKSTYKAAGVDIHAGYEVVRRIKKHVESTFRPEVLSGIGSFGSFFALDAGKYREPVLVAGTDGVGTKLKVAFMMDKHDTVGIDVVAYCVNDIICQGAEPLFFLDYLAVGKNRPEKIESIVAGIAEGCRQAGCALVGGETAEMPGFYPEDEYDLAGFTVGVVEKPRCITGQQAEAGDVVIGLASSGLQSSGFSLVRKIFFQDHGHKVTDHFDELGRTLGEELLEPTLVYVKPILSLINAVEITGIANISGGGMPENLPRSMPDNLDAVIRKGSWPIQPIFTIVQRLGEVDETEMYSTFNMGIGMTVTVKRDQAHAALQKLAEWGFDAYIIGELVPGQGEVVFA